MHLARDRRGATALEFAVVGGIFITLLLGVVEIARYQATAQAVRTLAAEAARAGLVEVNRNLAATSPTCTVSVTSASLLPRVPILQQGALSAFSVTVATEPANRCTAPVRSVTAQVSYNFSFIVRFLPGGTLTINERTTLPF